MEECPSISETILGFTLRERSSVAQVCLRSWKRISGSPARLSSSLKERFLRYAASQAAPRHRNDESTGRRSAPTDYNACRRLLGTGQSC
jgi:hypothetical protein